MAGVRSILGDCSNSRSYTGNINELYSINFKMNFYLLFELRSLVQTSYDPETIHVEANQEGCGE